MLKKTWVGYGHMDGLGRHDKFGCGQIDGLGHRRQGSGFGDGYGNGSGGGLVSGFYGEHADTQSDNLHVTVLIIDDDPLTAAYQASIMQATGDGYD